MPATSYTGSSWRREEGREVVWRGGERGSVKGRGERECECVSACSSQRECA